MDAKKKSDNPALSLFIADPEIVRLLRNSEQQLLKHRDELTTISTPNPDPDGISALRETVASIFPEQDITKYKRSAEAARRAALEELAAYDQEIGI
jgi:hypothetical protein